ncbi:MAG TPA: hypothetical protein VGP68_14535 [Gemmataceae bacterium]|jgi:hypothetical protein|nr:hypothetical protein [Gemmataceae bacterium]
MPGFTPNLALNAVAANTTSAATVLGSIHSKLSMQVVLTGAPSGGTVMLQGSLDGVNFDTAGLVTFTIGTDASGAIKLSVDKPVYAYRVVLAGLTGGTNPTVSATVGVDNYG